jgi:hypothetical protein
MSIALLLPNASAMRTRARSGWAGLYHAGAQRRTPASRKSVRSARRLHGVDRLGRIGVALIRRRIWWRSWTVAVTDASMLSGEVRVHGNSLTYLALSHNKSAPATTEIVEAEPKTTRRPIVHVA